MDGFERRKEQNRETIMRATESLIKIYGLSKVNINDIARQACVSQVTIYNLFGSKNALIHDCLENKLKRLTEGFHQILLSDKPYLEKLEDVFQFMIDVSKSHPEFTDLAVHNNEQLKQLIDSGFEQERKFLLEFTRQGKKQGYLNPDLSDEVIEAYLEIFRRGMASDPEFKTRKYEKNPRIIHDFLIIMFYGMARIDNKAAPRKNAPGLN